MVVGIDLDDTITNSSDIFLKYAKQYNYEQKIDFAIQENVLNQNEAFGWTKQNIEEFKRKYLKKILEETKPNPDCVKVINKIHSRGDKVIIITARSETELNDVTKITREWLTKNKIKYDKLIINSKAKEEDCNKNNISIFIDDNISNCERVYKKLEIPTFVFTTRYNKNKKINGIYRISSWKELEKRYIITHPLNYIDVNDKKDFPIIEEGKRYIHFYGGTKNYRAYIAPLEMSRTDFMQLYPEYVPIQNKPIYENNGIIVRADPKFPCPGFYIFALNKTYKAFDLLDDITFIRFCFVLKKIKEGMRSELNINYAHLLSNEKSDQFVNVHFWLVPVNGKTSPDLLDFDVKKYLNSFEPQKEKNKVLEYNMKLEKYIERINLMDLDNELMKLLKKGGIK